jgi:hypothetical protein
MVCLLLLIVVNVERMLYSNILTADARKLAQMDAAVLNGFSVRSLALVGSRVALF